MLKPEAFEHYVDRFNSDDEELYAQHIPNEQAWKQHKVTACQVIPAGDWHLMFYIGFRGNDIER